MSNIKFCKLYNVVLLLGEDVDLLEYDDPHIPAVLIKMFLRELPEPLLTFEAYDRVVGIRGKVNAYIRTVF